MKRLVIAGLLLAGCAPANDTAMDTLPPRVQTFAQLPDWTGYWDTAWVQSVTNPSGRAGDLSFDAIVPLIRLLEHPPYNDEWEPRYQEALKNAAAVAANRKLCDWRDFPLIMEAPTTFQVAITPEETLMVFHIGVVRHIFTDGRGHPDADNLWPTRMGHSIGRWENGELVVETVARAPGPVFVGPSAELSEKAVITERFRRVDENTLENRMTIVDPERFTRPWELTIQYKRAQGLDRMIEWNCEEDRNPVIDGKLGVAPLP